MMYHDNWQVLWYKILQNNMFIGKKHFLINKFIYNVHIIQFVLITSWNDIFSSLTSLSQCYLNHLMRTGSKHTNKIAKYTVEIFGQHLCFWVKMWNEISYVIDNNFCPIKILFRIIFLLYYQRYYYYNFCPFKLLFCDNEYT